MSGYIRSWADYVTGQASHAAKTTEKEAGAVGDRAKQAWTDFQHLPIGGSSCAQAAFCLPGYPAQESGPCVQGLHQLRT